jgi:hypothetical protein
MYKTFFAVFLVLLLAACGGGGSGQPSFPQESAFDTAVVEFSNNACMTTYSVHRDGTSQRGSQNCGATASAGTTNKVLPTPLTMKLFSDLQAAQPLNSLPNGLNSDFALQISWNGQQTPNLEAVFSTPNAMEQTLESDADAIAAEFPQ